MKSLFALLFFTVGMAQAQALTCFDVHYGPDHGYILSFAKNLGKATLSANTFAGVRPLAKLKCAKVAKPTNISGDEIYAILHCTQPGLADAGYSLVVEQGGIAGMTTATLGEVTIVGSKEVGAFNCH